MSKIIFVLSIKGCSRADRFLFNTNLVNEFHSEYNRYEFHKTSSQLHNPSVHNDNTVLEWKFSAMDLNKNNMLDRQEYRELKRLVKKVVYLVFIFLLYLYILIN